MIREVLKNPEDLTQFKIVVLRPLLHLYWSPPKLSNCVNLLLGRKMKQPLLGVENVYCIHLDCSIIEMWNVYACNCKVQVQYHASHVEQ